VKSLFVSLAGLDKRAGEMDGNKKMTKHLLNFLNGIIFVAE